MKMKVDISVIVPAYNSEKSLSRCVESIFSQSFKDFELIIVDDGSTDSTAEICDLYAKKDKRVKAIHKSNGGVSSARNTGLDLARGSYVAFIDSDDTVDSSYLETLMENAQYDFVTSGFQTEGPDGRWHEQRFLEEAVDCKMVSLHPSKYMGKYYFGAPWGKMYKKELIDRHKIRFLLNVHNGEDTIFIFNYLKHASTMKIVPYGGYNYHLYKTSLAHRISRENVWGRFKFEQCVNEFFKPCNYEEERWLENRAFEVLVGQVKEHFPHIKEQVYEVYYDDIFSRAIVFKKKYGNLMEHLFVFSMEHKCIELYLRICDIGVFCIRVKNKVKRTLWNGGNTCV